MEPSSTGLLGSLGISLPLFLGQLVNFAIVMFVMWKWVFTPLVALMDKRSKEIADGLKNAELAQAKLAEAEAEKERVIDAARAESNSLLEETRVKADAVRAEKMALAKKEIELVVDEAKERIKGEKQAAFDALKNEIANMVMLTTQKVAASMDEKSRQASVTQAMKDIEKA